MPNTMLRKWQRQQNTANIKVDTVIHVHNFPFLKFFSMFCCCHCFCYNSLPSLFFSLLVLCRFSYGVQCIAFLLRRKMKKKQAFKIQSSRMKVLPFIEATRKSVMRKEIARKKGRGEMSGMAYRNDSAWASIFACFIRSFDSPEMKLQWIPNCYQYLMNNIKYGFTYLTCNIKL